MADSEVEVDLTEEAVTAGVVTVGVETKSHRSITVPTHMNRKPL